MCRLFGFRSAVPSRAHRSLVEAENALAAQSAQHPDGWGIGWFVDDDAYVVKSATPAHSCEQFRRVSTRLMSHTFVVHVRRATVGPIGPLNVHPFRFGKWLFAHNGTIFQFDALRDWLDARLHDELRPQLLGETDSEHLFFYLLSTLADHGVGWNRPGQRDAVAVGAIVRKALVDLDAEATRRGVHRPITNVLLTDGQVFVAHRAGMPLHLTTQKRFCEEFATCAEPSKVCMEPVRPSGHKVNHLLVASEPIGADNLWEDVPDGATVTLTPDFHLGITAPAPGWVAPELPPEYRRPAEATC